MFILRVRLHTCNIYMYMFYCLFHDLYMYMLYDACACNVYMTHKLCTCVCVHTYVIRQVYTGKKLMSVAVCHSGDPQLLF